MAHNVLNIKNATLTLGAIDYADAITSATISITSTDSKWIPISGNVINETSVPEYTVELDFGQDFTAATTLMGVLLSKHGTTSPFVLKPKGGTAPSVTGVLLIKAPSQIGGGVGVATASASLPVNGVPVIVYGTGA